MVLEKQHQLVSSSQLKAKGNKVLVAAADTFRAAAIEQLSEWTNRAGDRDYCTKEGLDPAAVVYDATHAARARNVDSLIIDTAGRLTVKKSYGRTEKIDRVVSREAPMSIEKP